MVWILWPEGEDDYLVNVGRSRLRKFTLHTFNVLSHNISIYDYLLCDYLKILFDAQHIQLYSMSIHLLVSSESVSLTSLMIR